MNTDKRTKGEWEAFTYEQNGELSEIRIVAYDTAICQIDANAYGAPDTETIKANAAYICKAVNAHDKLVETLNKLFEAIESETDGKDNIAKHSPKVRLRMKQTYELLKQLEEQPIAM